VPDSRPIDDAADGGHAADHAAIDRLASELLPALIAKLGATGLGELEVRQDGWRVRLRRPADGVARGDRRPAGGAARSQPGHAGHGHGPLPTEGHRGARASASTNGAGPGQQVPVGPGPGMAAAVPTAGPAVAVSPAVGVFRPNPDTTAGRRVRAGDPLGVVDVLGVPQEVVAPVDGILGEQLVNGGEAVEYGQDLVVIEFSEAPAMDG
jgi:acetyl-CoA carboxylase biotin carboxyl carrier protein